MSSKRLIVILAVIVVLAATMMIMLNQPRVEQAPLTGAERAWLNRHQVIRIAPDPMFPPIEYFDNDGTYKGLTADYMARLEERLGVQFQVVKLPTWDSVLQAARLRTIDAITAAQKTPERTQYLRFTSPIVDIPNVIIARSESAPTMELEAMAGMRLAVTQGYALEEYIRTSFPHIVLVPVGSDLEALQEVSFRRADAAIVNLAVATFLIEHHGLSNLKVVGDSRKTNQLCIASRSDEPILNSILDKALESISSEDRKAMFRKWVGIHNETFLYSSSFWRNVLIASSVLLGVMVSVLLWNRTLRREVGNKTLLLERELTERRRAEENLKKSEERYRLLFDHNPHPTWVIEVSTRTFLAVNEAAVNKYGYSRDAFARMTVDDLAPADDMSQPHTNWADMQDGVTDAGVSRHRLNDGSLIDVELVAHPLMFDGKSAKLVLALDVTERKRAEQALRESEARLNSLLNTLPFDVWAVDTDGRYVIQNASAIRHWGYQAGKTFSEAFGNSSMAQQWEEQTRHALKGDPIQREVQYVVNGELKTYQMVQAPIMDNGSIRGSVGINIDITDRKLAEEALRESEERVRTTLYSIGDGVMTTDVECKVLQMNRAAETMTGWTESEARGKDVREVFRIVEEQTGIDMENPILQVARTGEIVPSTDPTLLLGRTGAMRPIAHTAAPIRNANREVIGAILVFNDQSEWRELQAQILQAQKMEAVGRLAGGIAHDFNNVIGVILGYGDLVLKRLNPMDPLASNVRAIISAAERSAGLTKQLLAFARKQVVTPVVCNLNKELASVETMLSRLVGEDIEMIVEPDHDLWNIKIDPSQIGQVLTNLATNARDAIKDVGTITITTANVVLDDAFCRERPEFLPGEYVLLTVRDTGVGMDKDSLERIFEPFFTTKPRERGTGLGMATVFGIVKQNNGFIEVESEPDKGTEFRIYFPRTDAEPANSPRSAEDSLPRGKGTILIVEDEKDLLTLASMALESAGFAILAAGSPHEAMELCKNHEREIDLLLTDVVMPGMNGKELRDRLVHIKPSMKTLFMSGYTADIVAHRGILEHGVNFLAKPFTSQALIAKVHDVLKGNGSA